MAASGRLSAPVTVHNSLRMTVHDAGALGVARAEIPSKHERGGMQEHW